MFGMMWLEKEPDTKTPVHVNTSQVPKKPFIISSKKANSMDNNYHYEYYDANGNIYSTEDDKNKYNLGDTIKWQTWTKREPTRFTIYS